MPRRTKEEIRKDRNLKRIDTLVSTLKYLANPKYYKNNRWSMAAFDSWAARGQAGSCGCGCGKYNGSLTNKRHNTERGGRISFVRELGVNACYDCIQLIEDKINFKFARY